MGRYELVGVHQNWTDYKSISMVGSGALRCNGGSVPSRLEGAAIVKLVAELLNSPVHPTMDLYNV